MEFHLITWAEAEYLLRIFLAAVCGGAVGFERERRFKSAGTRTHLIVALSACLMMVVSKYGFFDVAGTGGLSVDASRIGAGVVSAIGFLGAGVIFFRKDTVSGVTTAAGLWATVGVGISFGTGLYFTGLSATLLLLLIQLVLHRKTPLVKTHRSGTVVLRMEESKADSSELYQLLSLVAVHIDNIELRRMENEQIELRCEVLLPADFNADDMLQAVKMLPELCSIEMDLP
ncbi:MAG: MgtC/SapB family protein [Oscillospiraceae bacterium]|nr:MgtC/SapB family protein [Oscillospiraceae bacterium]